jgi:signal transduction histidine kinase/ligand-binding sensor domain-containing protein
VIAWRRNSTPLTVPPRPAGRNGPLPYLPALLALVFSPALALDPDRSLREFHHSKWTIGDGAPGQIGAIAQTREGYLWIGAGPSLFRFDGIRFEPYMSTDGESFGTVSSLHAPTSGGLWVGLRRGGAAFIEHDRFIRYDKSDGLPTGAIYGLATDHDGNVWAAANDGLARFDGTHWQQIAETWGFLGRNARAVHVDRAGNVWAASEERLFYLPRDTRTFIDSGESVGWVSRIAEAPDGSLWIAEHHGGAVRKVMGTGARSLAAKTVIDTPSAGLLFDRDGTLWIGTLGDGLQRVIDASSLTDKSVVDKFTSAEGLTADYTGPLLEDREGNVWVGTSAGLDRFRHGAIVRAPFPSGAHNFALAADRSGNVWAGTLNRSTMRHSRGTVHILDIPPPITSAHADETGTVWLGGPNGIWRSNGDALIRVASLPTEAGAESTVRAMVVDRRGTLWVSINRLGLFTLHGDRWSRVPPHSDHPEQLMPVSASRDRNGRLWFGYRNNLIVTHDGPHVQKLDAESGLAIGNVTAMYHGRDRSWIAGQFGVALFDGERFRSLPSVDGDLFLGVYGIIETRGCNMAQRVTNDHERGSLGDLWIHANAGIFCIPATEVRQALEDPQHLIAYRSFPSVDGLPDDPIQVRPVPTAIEDKEGHLWFATGNGVIWLDPQQLYENPLPPPVLIETLRADDRPFPTSARAALTARTRRVEIRYTALSLAVPEGIRFRYRLDGYDTNWHDAGARREAVYTALPPGRYRFHVLAANSDGVWNEQGAELTFEIPPTFYQTKTFLALCIAAVLGFLWWLYRRRMRRAADQVRLRLEERHAERERIARELHDTLLQSLQTLVLRVHAATRRVPSHEPARRLLEETLDRADEVIAEGRDRIKDLRATTAISALSDALSRVGDDMARDDIAFSIETHGEPRPLDTAIRDEVYCIGREALINAFQHAYARRIEVHVIYGTRALRLRVRDDGRAIDRAFMTPDGRPEHWGLRGMHERASRIAAALEVRSRTDTGTEVELIVPAGTIYSDAPRGHRLRIFAARQMPSKDRG